MKKILSTIFIVLVIWGYGQNRYSSEEVLNIDAEVVLLVTDSIPVNGVVYSGYGDELYQEISFKNGIKDGLSRGWYEKGKLKYEHNYTSGILNGLSKSWYINGQLSYKQEYKEGKPFGILKRWYEDGKLMYETEFLNGTGVDRTFWGNGNLYLEVNYNEGIIDGSYKTWYSSGEMFEEKNFKKGVLDGLHKVWGKNGIQEFELHFKNGMPDGKLKRWYEDGELMYEADFVLGSGIDKVYFQNRKVYTIIKVKNGELVNSECWNENGEKAQCPPFPKKLY